MGLRLLGGLDELRKASQERKRNSAEWSIALLCDDQFDSDDVGLLVLDFLSNGKRNNVRVLLG